MRVEQNQNITSALAESKKSLASIDGQNKQMSQLRDQLEAMHAQMMQMQNNIRSAQIKNDNLKNVSKLESDLRKNRDTNED